MFPDPHLPAAIAEERHRELSAAARIHRLARTAGEPRLAWRRPRCWQAWTLPALLQRRHPAAASGIAPDQASHAI
jgi:hypothetical protein